MFHISTWKEVFILCSNLMVQRLHHNHHLSLHWDDWLSTGHTEDGRSMSVFLLYGQLSQGRMVDFPAFIASKSFDLWNHHIPKKGSKYHLETVQTIFSENNNYYRTIFVKLNFFHAWKCIISGVKYRSKFWHLRRKLAVIFLKLLYIFLIHQNVPQVVLFHLRYMMV